VSNLAALRSVFANRNFAIYVSANGVSLIGFWMQRLAISWLTWELTESEFWVGAVAFAELAPLLFVSPIVGVLADHFNRKHLTMMTQCGMMLQSLVLYLLIIFNVINVGLLFFFALLDGILQAAHQPIRLSIVPNLVKRKDIVSASSFTAVSFNVARLLGPALAGVVISLFGTATAVLCNAVTYVPILIAWFYIQLPQNKSELAMSSIGKGIKEGVSYIRNIPALGHIFILQTILACGIRPVTLMLAAFVGAVYTGGANDLAMFTAVLGFGAVAGGMYITLRGRAQGLVMSMLLNSLVSIAGLAIFASTSYYILGLVMIFIVGWSVTLSAVASQTLIQNSIDDKVRGRVLSLWAAATRGATAIGVLVIGLFADFFGLFWPNIIAALLCLWGLGWFWRHHKQMRTYFEAEDLSEP
jgi:MFS family permease